MQKEGSLRLVDLIAASLLGMGVICNIETFLLIYITFQRRTGLYFWSLIITTSAQVAASIGFMLEFFSLEGSCGWISMIFYVLGYIAWTPFEYLLLYSRLHLLRPSTMVLRVVLLVIVTEFCLIEIPVTISWIGATARPLSRFPAVYNVLRRIESIVYAMVDLVLTGLYIYHIKKMWYDSSSNKDVRRVLRNVQYMALFVVIADVAYIISSYIADYNLYYGIYVRDPRITPS